MSDFKPVSARSGKHVFNCRREIGKRFHESDDALAFLNFDLCVFDSPDLFVYESIETAGKLAQDLRECLGKVVLVGLL